MLLVMYQSLPIISNKDFKQKNLYFYKYIYTINGTSPLLFEQVALHLPFLLDYIIYFLGQPNFLFDFLILVELFWP